MKLGLVGIGAIATKQHMPALKDNPDIELVAAASHEGSAPGVPNFSSLSEMLAGAEVEAVALCVPPAARHALAREAIASGRHVFMEKPPTMTLGALNDLTAMAAAAGVTLFASWHSRHAAAVAPLKAALGEANLRAVTVEWKENVRVFHPGQRWIWEPGGFGVFDPGINAFSILTEALPRPLMVRDATHYVPANAATPIRAELAFADTAGVPLSATFDFDHRDEAIWSIVVESDAGTFTLSEGGKRLTRDGAVLVDEEDIEYGSLYDHFVALVTEGRSDVDARPLQLVADCMLLARVVTVEPFVDDGAEGSSGAASG